MSFCGMECCRECSRAAECGGCEACGGHPFGGSCVAERNRDFAGLKQRLIEEINALGIPGLNVRELYLLTGEYVNLAYPLPDGSTVKLLKDRDVYLGNQIPQEGSGRCFGIVANEALILVAEYGPDGAEPELVLYKRR